MRIKTHLGNVLYLSSLKSALNLRNLIIADSVCPSWPVCTCCAGCGGCWAPWRGSAPGRPPTPLTRSPPLRQTSVWRTITTKGRQGTVPWLSVSGWKIIPYFVSNTKLTNTARGQIISMEDRDFITQEKKTQLLLFSCLTVHVLCILPFNIFK